MQYDVVVLGAGAAGMMCAFEASKRGRRVLLLEHGERVGRKILISGGGRCNFTNVRTKAENFLSENPHFAKSALARFTPRDFVALVEKHGIKYHEKTLGQLFCDDSAKQIVAMLERECAQAGVETRCGVTVRGVRRAQASDANPGAPDSSQARFVVETSAGSFACASVVVATGGLSIPAMGATGFGYDLARAFGHAIVEPRAGLVPLVFSVADRERWCDLAGVAFEVVARTNAAAEAAAKTRGKAPVFREALLVTL
jgi:predicted Rossmann fold flavoprotein